MSSGEEGAVALGAGGIIFPGLAGLPAVIENGPGDVVGEVVGPVRSPIDLAVVVGEVGLRDARGVLGTRHGVFQVRVVQRVGGGGAARVTQRRRVRGRKGAHREADGLAIVFDDAHEGEGVQGVARGGEAFFVVAEKAAPSEDRRRHDVVGYFVDRGLMRIIPVAVFEPHFFFLGGAPLG